MDLRVLNVGDGACAVLSSDTEYSALVVDCGATSRGRGEESAKVAAEAVGARGHAIDSVLITHFDADHWAGIAELPRALSFPPPRIKLYYPHLLPREPRKVQAAHLLFQSALVGGPVALISDIIHKWESAGVHVDPHPVWRGSTFAAAGADWTVHWPPRDLGDFENITVTNLRELVKKIDSVADRDDNFRRALDEVQHDWYRQSQIQDPEEEERFHERDSDIAEMPAATVLESVKQEVGSEEFVALADELRKYTNMLSVVHTSKTFANFGDCEKTGLNALLRAHRDGPLRLEPVYDIILAPHHGTQIPGVRTSRYFPTAMRAIVNQNGESHCYKGLVDPEVQHFRVARLGGRHTEIVDIFLNGHFYASGLR
ncbi:MBL fold metallo-hydrolase [Microbacterium maritypicum]|uniref:MBL fold metallo-hydrolase n=1 Tax=Microbacterium maritypicum TaxID=33918 RepID=UPI00382013C7